MKTVSFAAVSYTHLDVYKRQAVMGSKNLKAVVVKGTKGLSVANPMLFNKAVTDAREKVKANAVTGTGGGLATYGTEILVNILNEMHAFPTNNWQSSRFEEAEKISGEYLTENYLVRNKACFACPIEMCIRDSSRYLYRKRRRY